MKPLIKVAARESKLSRAQVEEAAKEFGLEFEVVYVKTKGDLDRETSLRTLDKCDFFTKEIDEMVLDGRCRLGIHSAKDLPDPMPAGLKIVALSKGVDSSDALVLREGERLQAGMMIATSSERREECVRELGIDLDFVDIRGTIEERLKKLSDREVDGVVIAEAALIRLGLTHLNRIRLPGETVPLQGRLALVAREEDKEITPLFDPSQPPAQLGLAYS